MDVNIIAPIHTQIVPFNTMRIIVCIYILKMKKFWRAVDQALDASMNYLLHLTTKYVFVRDWKLLNKAKEWK